MRKPYAESDLVTAFDNHAAARRKFERLCAVAAENPEMSFAELAERFGLSVKSVRRHVSRENKNDE